MAKFIVTPTEVEAIVREYVSDQGLSVSGCSIKMEKYKTYEYYGDPQNEKRREIEKERLAGVEVEVAIFNESMKG